MSHRRSLQQSLPPMEVRSVAGTRSSAVNSVDGPASSPVQKVDQERAWLQLVDAARAKAVLQQQQLADRLRVDPSLLSAQLAGVEGKHLSYRRMWRAGADVWHELVLLIIDFYDLQIGLSDEDRRDLELGRTVRQALERRIAR